MISFHPFSKFSCLKLNISKREVMWQSALLNLQNQRRYKNLRYIFFLQSKLEIAKNFLEKITNITNYSNVVKNEKLNTDEENNNFQKASDFRNCTCNADTFFPRRTSRRNKKKKRKKSFYLEQLNSQTNTELHIMALKTMVSKASA